METLKKIDKMNKLFEAYALVSYAENQETRVFDDVITYLTFNNIITANKGHILDTLDEEDPTECANELYKIIEDKMIYLLVI